MSIKRLQPTAGQVWAGPTSVPSLPRLMRISLWLQVEKC